MKSLSFACTLIALMWSALSHGQAGALDASFGGGDGLVTTSFFPNHSSFGFDLAIQDDGKIVVAGVDENVSHFSSVVVVRYGLDGMLDPTFNGSGKLIVSLQNTQGFLRSMALQPDQKILLLITYQENNETGIAIHRLLPDGSPDLTFNGTGSITHTFMATYTSGNDIILQPDGSILVCGYYGFLNDVNEHVFVMRFTPEGQPDDTFGIHGVFSSTIGETYSDLYTMQLQEDGRILCAGFTVLNGSEEFMALRLTADGNPDFSYSDDGVAIASFSNQDDRAYSLQIQPDGKAVLAGSAYNFFTSTTSFALARFDTDGELDPDFNGDGMNLYTISGYADLATSLVLQPDGKMIMGGYVHSNVNGGSDMAIMRVLPNGIPDMDWSEDGVANYVDDLETSSALQKLALQPDGLLVGTGYVRKDDINSIRVARFISGIVTSSKEVQENADIPYLSISPNPFSEQISVSYTLKESSFVRLSLRSLEGKDVQIQYSGAVKAPGNYTERLRVPAYLSDGIYLLTLQTDNSLRTIKVFKSSH